MKSVSSKESGQAVIEYILVLIVVVSILLGVMWQFNDGFRKFTNSYFGDYLACLLELGELPALGGPTSGQCHYEWPDGKSPSNPDGSKTAGGDDNKGKDSSSPPSKSSSANNGGGGGSGAAESVGRFGSNYSGASRDGRPATVVMGQVKTDSYTGSTEATSGKRADTAANKGGSLEVVDQSGGVIDPFEQRKVKEDKVAVAKGTVADNLRSKKTRVTINRKVASTDYQDKDKAFGFGDWMRWLLIAAIIVALVVFFGSQAMSISKSWE